MPIVPNSGFLAPLWFSNNHLQTVWANVFRSVHGVVFTREKIETEDSDFLNLDWSTIGSGKLVIITHGLEGHSRRPYMLGMVKELNNAGFDALAWNFRSCGGEMNQQKIFYHGGMTCDLERVIEHAETKGTFSDIYLVGFSLGGNMSLRLLGEWENKAIGRIRKAAMISVPIDLSESVDQMNKDSNRPYMKRFMKEYRRKLFEKARTMPGEFNLEPVTRMKNMRDWDEHFIAPIHGFESAEHMYRETSSRFLLSQIRIPSLLINAIDDPFLTPGCFPVEEAGKNPFLFLEMPESGGHLGFFEGPLAGYYSEKRVSEWLKN